MKESSSKVVLRERARAGGRRRFVVRYGVLGWGLPTALIGASLFNGMGQGFTWSSLTSRAALVHLLIWIIVVGVMGGYLWGHVYWTTAERNRTRSQTGSDEGTSPPQSQIWTQAMPS